MASSVLTTMAKMDGLLMKSKFRGCMLGTLMGDCLGAPFEGDPYSPGGKLIVQRYFDKLEEENLNIPLKQYTDDTAMTKCIAQCLVGKPDVDFKFMAKSFVVEYFKEPRRGYGRGAMEVFHKLRKEKFNDIYKPANDLFRGTGSFGNGGAMRVSPIALYFHNDYETMLNVAKKSTEITHTNDLGILGALLQCIAIQQSLLIPSTTPIDVNTFTDNLIKKMEEIEKPDDELPIEQNTPYQTQLKLMKEILNVQPPEEPVSEEEIIASLGTNIDALHSVPTAIYCFLKAQKAIPGINTDNIFRRTIQYAISLAGDADTIASMAGSIAGAYLGEENISPSLRKYCEYQKEMTALADNLYSSLPKPL